MPTNGGYSGRFANVIRGRSRNARPDLRRDYQYDNRRRVFFVSTDNGEHVASIDAQHAAAIDHLFNPAGCARRQRDLPGHQLSAFTGSARSRRFVGSRLVRANRHLRKRPPGKGRRPRQLLAAAVKPQHRLRRNDTVRRAQQALERRRLPGRSVRMDAPATQTYSVRCRKYQKLIAACR